MGRTRITQTTRTPLLAVINFKRFNQKDCRNASYLFSLFFDSPWLLREDLSGRRAGPVARTLPTRSVEG